MTLHYSNYPNIFNALFHFSYLIFGTNNLFDTFTYNIHRSFFSEQHISNLDIYKFRKGYTHADYNFS